MHADLETDIRAASEAGFDGIELWKSKLVRFLEHRTSNELRALLSEFGLQPFSINSIERITFRNESGRRQLIQECLELCRIASEIDCRCIVVVPSPLSPGIACDQVTNESADVLVELGARAASFNVSLGFEFLGQQNCSVQTLELARKIVTEVNSSNVGLVIDSFHFYAGESKLESIDSLDPKELLLFHINDAEDLPRSELEDRHRLLPGLGILPLKEMVKSLNRIGYDGVASVEIFRPEYWEMDPFLVARLAREAAARTLELDC